MNRLNMKKIAIGTATAAVAAALTIGGASAALADDNGQSSNKTPGSNSQQAGPRGDKGMHGDQGGMHRGGPLAALVAKGTITQADADAVKAALDANRTANQAAHDAQRTADRDKVLADLVSKGTITQAQADALKSADRGGDRTLVSNGTITQAQASAIRDAMRAAHDANETTEQAARKAELNTMLAGLVSKGTLTQAKADAIAADMATNGLKGGGHGGPGGHGGKRGHGPAQSSGTGTQQ